MPSFKRVVLAMDAISYSKIAVELDRLQKSGILGEYFIRWRGPSGQVEPIVTVWTKPAYPRETVRQFVSATLSGLVVKENITVTTE